MAHLLNKATDGSWSFASSMKEPAWHGLGQNVGHVMTAEEAIKEANLGFEVQKFPILREDGITVIESHMETRRMDNDVTLGVVGKDYEVVQNWDCFKFFDNIVGRKEAIYETAGVLGKGEVIFITARLPKEIVIGRDDLIHNYVALITSHDMSYALTAFFTPVRIVCNNTMNAAMRNCMNRVYMKHTKNVQREMFDGARIMGLNSRYMDQLAIEMGYLYDKKIAEDEVRELLTQVFLSPVQQAKGNSYLPFDLSTRKKNTIQEVIDYYHYAETQKGIKGTAYGLYHAVTGYFQNRQKFTNDTLKMKSVMLHGTAYQYQQKAFNLLLKHN
jgi:phage/plasmid-like protein (TIGR03299 family)